MISRRMVGFSLCGTLKWLGKKGKHALNRQGKSEKGQEVETSKGWRVREPKEGIRQSHDKATLGKEHRGTSQKFGTFFEVLFSRVLMCQSLRAGEVLRSSFVTCPSCSLVM